MTIGDCQLSKLCHGGRTAPGNITGWSAGWTFHHLFLTERAHLQAVRQGHRPGALRRYRPYIFSDPYALHQGNAPSSRLPGDPGPVWPDRDQGQLGAGAQRKGRGRHPHQEHVQGVWLAEGQRDDLGRLLGAHSGATAMRCTSPM